MISTSRLEIKPFTDADAQSFFDLASDDGFNAYSIKIYRQQNLETARQWIIDNQNSKWAVWEKSSGILLGVGGLTPWELEGEKLVDITYRLRSLAQGKGYGLELAKALVEYGFNKLNLKEITATITPDNIPSIKLAEKLGMKFDQTIILFGVTTDVYRLIKF